MKYTFIACGLLLGTLLQAQTPSGGDRICGEHFNQTGLYGLSYREALEKTVAQFSAYQDYLFSRLAADPPDFGDIRLLTKRAQELSEHYFLEQGFEPNGQIHPFGIGESAQLQWQYVYPDLPEEEAREVLNRLQACLYRYRPEAHTRYLKELMELREQALLLKEEADVFAAGVPVSIALGACRYWHTQGDKWMLIFGRPSLVLQEKISTVYRESLQTAPCRSSTWHLQASAASGAVKGILEAGEYGSPEAWKQGLLQGCAASAGNFFNQVIHCGIDWWPY
jgi:hypothetical protein